MPVTFTLDGKTCTLRYSLKVLKQLEQEHGLSLLRGGEGIVAHLQDPAKLAVLLYHGMRTGHPEITLEWIEENVEASMLLALMPLLVYAASGRWIGDPAPNGAAAAPSTGLPSGLSVDTTSVSRKTNSGA